MSTPPPPPPPSSTPPPNAYRTPRAGGPPSRGGGGGSASAEVQSPATGLMVTGIIGGVFALLGLLMNIFGAGLGTMMEEGQEQFVQMLSGGLGIVQSLIGLVVAGFIFYAAQQMKNLENWGLAMGGSIVAMVPCVSPCCIIGLPIGIWCVVVLNKDYIKNAFR